MALIAKLNQNKSIDEIRDEMTQLKDEANLDIFSLIQLEPLRMVEHLKRIDGFDTKNMESLAIALSKMYVLNDEPIKSVMRNRARFLLEYIEQEEQTYSFERQDILKELNDE